MPPPRLIDKLDCYNALVFAFCEFLTVSIHLLLYERNIYPRTSFKAVRKYNHAVRQSRHPKVCEWIRDAVEAVKIEMLKVRTPICFHLARKRVVISLWPLLIRRTPTLAYNLGFPFHVKPSRLCPAILHHMLGLHSAATSTRTLFLLAVLCCQQVKPD